jgi:hypothetical protein
MLEFIQHFKKCHIYHVTNPAFFKCWKEHIQHLERKIQHFLNAGKKKYGSF